MPVIFRFVQCIDLLHVPGFFLQVTDLQEKAWNVQEINTLDEPKNNRHFLYARFDLHEKQLKLYDDRLQQVRLEALKITTYPSHFINDKLTIKNLMTMNMKNFE